MIKVVLLDLDDTLADTSIDRFFPRYLEELGRFAAHISDPATFVSKLLSAYGFALAENSPLLTLYERFLKRFSNEMSVEESELVRLFDQFYAHQYPVLKAYIQPFSVSSELLASLEEREIPFLIATNPGLPLQAAAYRMRWAGIPADAYDFKLITTIENMHFGKPHPEYYSEIVQQMGVEPDEAVMVGDSWEQDILGAHRAGLHTYWICAPGDHPPGENRVSAYGTLSDFNRLVRTGWLDTQEPRVLSQEATIIRLSVFPAIIDTICREYSVDVLECVPGEDEWSVRDIVCHLHDHEQDELVRFAQILNRHNPFLSANTNPWSGSRDYREQKIRKALEQFAEMRAETVRFLAGLEPADWDRPARDAIFGPITLRENVRFVAEHDRTHLAQMREAIAYALTVCG
nr:HAD-IA family hydrolase [Anaerolineae bacterium]